MCYTPTQSNYELAIYGPIVHQCNCPRVVTFLDKLKDAQAREVHDTRPYRGPLATSLIKDKHYLEKREEVERDMQEALEPIY